jgi:hypothetical protein
MIGIRANEVIMRHLRIRPGIAPSAPDGTELDAISGRGVRNVILDHISASWGNDEVLSFYNNENLTVQ